MTVVEKMAQAIWDRAMEDDPVDPFGYNDLGNGKTVLDGYYDLKAMARAALTALHDSFADPVVRAAIQAALDEKEG